MTTNGKKETNGERFPVVCDALDLKRALDEILHQNPEISDKLRAMLAEIQHQALNEFLKQEAKTLVFTSAEEKGRLRIA